jgi:hypothetical protein
MKIFKAQRRSFLIIATGLISLYPLLACGNSEPLGVSSSESSGVPLEQLGVGIFSRIPFHLSLSVRGGYDDNLTTSNFDKHGSWFGSAGAVVTYEFGSPRTQVSLSTTTAMIYHADDPVGAEFEPNLNLNFSLNHKASPRLGLTLLAYLVYQAEPDFSIAQGTNRRSGNYFSTQDKFTAAYLWTPRFSTATSYSFSAVRYDHSAVGFFEDRIENTLGNEFRFLVWPTTTAVAEYRFGVVSYQHDIERDSTTQFILAGFDHSFNPRFSASFRGGAEFRDYENNGQQNAPYFETTVNYALGKDTSLQWTNRYSIEEGEVTLNQSRKTFRTGLQIKYNLISRVATTLGAYYQNDDYLESKSSIGTGAPSKSPPFSEQSFDLALSLRYSLTRYLGLEAGYNYTNVSSDMFFREYTRNRVWGGLNFAF